MDSNMDVMTRQIEGKLSLFLSRQRISVTNHETELGEQAVEGCIVRSEDHKPRAPHLLHRLD
jgi:hypothetical protein